MKALIIGYGRAGQRHKKILGDFDIDAIVYDPFLSNAEVDYGEEYSLHMTLAAIGVCPIAVIASPPNEHIQQIVTCLRHGMYVLCEKPLCDFGELDDAITLYHEPNIYRLMVAYNYRFADNTWPSSMDGEVELTASQTRENRPGWGYLLDHVSHDLDIISISNPLPLLPLEAVRRIGHDYEEWKISGSLGEGKFRIRDRVYSHTSTEREAWYTARTRIDSRYQQTRIEADPEMYTRMWKAFLSGMQNNGIPYVPGLTEALRVQIALEKIRAIARVE